MGYLACIDPISYLGVETLPRTDDGDASIRIEEVEDSTGGDLGQRLDLCLRSAESISLAAIPHHRQSREHVFL